MPLEAQTTVLPSTLTPADLHRLEQDSWIDQATAQAFGLYRVDTHEGAELVGRNDSEDYSGIVFPVYWPGEVKAREYFLRRDHPSVEGGKSKGKYLAPPGRGNKLLFGPGESVGALDDTTIPIVLVEGLKKLVVGYRLSRYDSETPRVLACGLSGAWNWRGTIGKALDAEGARVDVKGPIPDLDRILWAGRAVAVVFDSDAATNEDVARARRGLVAELRRRGGYVRVIDLPPLAGLPKVGFDDFVARRGPELALALLRRRVRPYQQHREGRAV